MSETTAAKELVEAPACMASDIGMRFTVAEGMESNPEAVAAVGQATKMLNDYLSIFAAPGKGCIGCGTVLGGNLKDNLAGIFIGSFEWGIAHGEGRCGKCGYPGRARHYVSLGEDGEVQFANILQYRRQP